MADKSGTPQQQRNAFFPTTPAKATGGCPLNGPDVAIIPMRYALDRSRYDENPKKLKPLLKTGKWAALPALKTRSYTLRQLYTGYVYVYDETSKALHEYEYAANTGLLTRIKWTEADTGKDKRSGAGESKNHLVYPRKNQLHIAYAPKQWTWRICEHMRSNPGSRKEWMKALDLPSYCITQAARDTLPLSSLADAVADVDKGAVVSDERFADSAIPAMAPAGKSIGEAVFSPLAADVFWTGSVPDKDSALVIAIDAPLEVLNDLGMQLAADHAAYQRWQEEHEHKIQIANTVEALCGASLAPEKTPSSVRGDAVKTRQYQRDLDAYYTQRELEEDQAIADSISGSPPMVLPADRFQAVSMGKAYEKQYATNISDSDYQAWKARGKWRRHVDLDGAHAYIQNNQKNGETLLQQVNESQSDFEIWAKHIGTIPEKLFYDTTNEAQLLDLQNTFANLLIIYCQNNRSSEWLAKEEVKSTSLFGSVRYGFSESLKAAFGEPSNKLLDGLGDYTTLATRAGEINGLINHEGFSEQPWIKSLKKSVQDTYKNLSNLAIDKGKKTANAILLALIPSDSRLASGKNQSMVTLLRNMLIGQVLSNSPERIVVDKEILSKIDRWKSEQLDLKTELTKERKQWTQSKKTGSRRSQGQKVRTLEAHLNIHELNKPGILDFQNNKYAALMRDDIRKFATSKADIAKSWTLKAKNIAQRGGINSASITWGVIILNLINTANTYQQLAKDGEVDEKDLTKIAYGAGYSANLLVAVFVESKWSSLKGLSTSINNESVGIMERSAAYWSSTKGETKLWGATVSSFNRRLVAMGGFAVLATALELWDIQDDYTQAKSTSEKAALWAKGLAVFGMGAGGMVQLLAATVFRTWTVVVMGPWFAFAMLVMGAIYLLATMALNYFKNDAVGLWLSKCSWSITKKISTLTPSEQAEEHRSLLEIQLSPQVHVHSTVEYKRIYVPREGSRLVPFQNGAWVQWRLPKALRGHTLEFNITGSKSPLNFLPVSKTEDPVQDPFLDGGEFVGEDAFEKTTSKAPPLHASPNGTSPIAGSDECYVWQTWVPLRENTDFLEFQIWYPPLIVSGDSDDRGYLYQVELNTDGNTEADGLSKTNLQVKSSDRLNALVLVIKE